MIAMRSDHADIAKILIEAGADLALKNDAGETALDIAQEKRHQDIINLLEKKLAEPATQPLQSALQVLQHHLSNVSKALKRT